MAVSAIRHRHRGLNNPALGDSISKFRYRYRSFQDRKHRSILVGKLTPADAKQGPEKEKTSGNNGRGGPKEIC